VSFLLETAISEFDGVFDRYLRDLFDSSLIVS